MFKRVAVGDIMTRNLITVRPNTNLHTCAKKLIKQKVNTLLITKNGKLLGILTARDILWAVIKKSGKNLRDVEVMDIATRKVAVIKPSADINQAFQKMKKFGFRRLPVLSRGNLVGMLTLKDILRVDPSLYNEVGSLFYVREETQKLRKLHEQLESEIEGQCDECGDFTILTKNEGKLICQNCVDALY